jgi:DNA polymerase III delta prime subunit
MGATAIILYIMFLMSQDFLFCEKYTPKTMEEVILPKDLKNLFIGIRDSGKTSHMTLAGPQGCGKTSTIRALAKELQVDFMMINGSKERSIDTIRTTVESYASSVSMYSSGKKILLIDEADNLTQDAQKAFLGVIEATQKNCTFVLTCNYPNRIDLAVLSRCPIVNFKFPKEEKPQLLADFYTSILKILEENKIKVEDKKVVAKLVAKYFPDFRRTLNILQQYSASGEINSSVLAQVSDIKVSTLYKAMKERNFGEVRKWAINNLDNDATMVLRSVYDGLEGVMKPYSIPAAILIIHEHMACNVMDNEVNLITCFIKLMMEDAIEFL